MYQFSEKSAYKWLSDWKATLYLDILMILICNSIICYYIVFVDKSSRIGESYLLVYLMAIISVFNSFVFHYKDRWKLIVNEFNHVSDKDARLNNIIGLTIILVVIANFVLSFYLFYNC